MLGTLLLIILLDVIPRWPHSSGRGYGPSGAAHVVLIIVLMLLPLGHI